MDRINYPTSLNWLLLRFPSTFHHKYFAQSICVHVLILLPSSKKVATGDNCLQVHVCTYIICIYFFNLTFFLFLGLSNWFLGKAYPIYSIYKHFSRLFVFFSELFVSCMHFMFFILRIYLYSSLLILFFYFLTVFAP